MTNGYVVFQSIIDCIRNDCAEEIMTICQELRSNCKLHLYGLKNFVILKGEEVLDKIGRDDKICDCLIFIMNTYNCIVLVELKRYNENADEIKEKFENGLTVVFDILNNCLHNERTHITLELYLIALAKSWKRTIEHRFIIRKFVEFRGERFYINAKECGDSLLEIKSKLIKAQLNI